MWFLHVSHRWSLAVNVVKTYVFLRLAYVTTSLAAHKVQRVKTFMEWD